MLERFNYIFLGTDFIRGHKLEAALLLVLHLLSEMTISFTTDSEERFFLLLKYTLLMALITFKGSCSRILQNNSLWGFIRAAWH